MVHGAFAGMPEDADGLASPAGAPAGAPSRWSRRGFRRLELLRLELLLSCRRVWTAGRNFDIGICQSMWTSATHLAGTLDFNGDLIIGWTGALNPGICQPYDHVETVDKKHARGETFVKDRS